MSEIGEAMGTAVEGGLFARVLGRRQGDKPLAETDPEASGLCLNCSTPLTGEFCHACGQKAHIHRTITAILHDLIHGVLHLDGKFWRTLPLLAWKPGKLTRDYIDGKRARYVSPMAIFLFSVFFMFAVFQVAGITTPTSISAPTDAQMEAGMEAAREKAEEELAKAEADVDTMATDDPERAAAEARLKSARESMDALEKVGTSLFVGDGSTMTFKGTGIKSIDDGILKKWRENPSLMLYKLQNNSYKFSWLLIPISIPFVWLLFAWKRRFKAYDHAIFVTYSLAFMSLLFVLISVLGVIGAPAELLVLAGMLIPPFHMYRQLRGTYALSRFSALWRTAALATMIVFIVVVIFLWLLLLLGAF